MKQRKEIVKKKIQVPFFQPLITNKDKKEIVLKASRASRAYMVGVDHIIHKGKPYLLEINGSPGSGADYEGYQHRDYYSDAEPSGAKQCSQIYQHTFQHPHTRTQPDI